MSFSQKANASRSLFVKINRRGGYIKSVASLTSGVADALTERMRRRLEAEEYFARTGRTFRKSRSRLWFNECLKPRLMEAAFRASGLYGIGHRNALTPRVHEVEFQLPRLPAALDGFRILHISDLHIDKIDGLAERLADLIAPVQADICLITGDYRYEIRGDCSGVYPRMRLILDSIQSRHGIFAILGNHDSSEIAFWLADQGVSMLMNDAARVDQNGARLYVAGVDDPHDYRCDDLPGALEHVPAGAFTVLMAHTPVLYREAAEAGIDLYLCGHTHAGQVRLPGIGAVKKNGPYPRAFVQDKWSYNDMQAYTSWGAGCSTLPVRFNCPPEIAVLRLRTA